MMTCQTPWRPTQPPRYTDDGVHVHGLVHDEYHARASEGAPASQCPSQVDNNCWYSSLLAALSTDGGATFSLVPGVGNSSVVVAAPFPYVPDAGTQGVPAHRHIVQSPFDGYFYTMPNCAYLHQMKRATGKCVWRTDDLTAPTSWRAWNGTAWGTRGVNPYVAPPSASMMPMYTAKAVNTHLNGGLTFVQAVGEFVIVGSQTNEQGVVSIMYQSSRDLVSWSPARVLVEIPLRPSLPPTSKDGLYPTMLDPADPSRNFDRFGQTGHIYWTEFDCQSKGLCWRRNVVRYPLAVKSLE